MNINTTMKVIGWAGTLFAGALAARGLGEFLPATKVTVYALGGALEIMNIAGLTWLSSKNDSHPALKCCMATLCAIVLLLDVVGVSGQLTAGYQAAKNSHAATNEQANTAVAAKIEAAQAIVAGIDREISAVDAAIAAAEQAKLSAGKNKGRAEAAERARAEAAARRDTLTLKRNAAADAVTALKIEAGKARGQQINASTEFAAVQFVGVLFGLDPDTVANAVLATLSAMMTLFSVVMLLAAGHGSAHAAPADAEPVKVVVVAPPVVAEPVTITAPPAAVPTSKAKDPVRVAAGKKAAATRAANKAASAQAAAIREAAMQAAEAGGKIVALRA